MLTQFDKQLEKIIIGNVRQISHRQLNASINYKLNPLNRGELNNILKLIFNFIFCQFCSENNNLGSISVNIID